jgi:curli biogenesis system outer membrane secretion channel CsgG
MTKLKIIAAGIALLAGAALAADPAMAQGMKRVENNKGSTKQVDIPRCTKSLGTVALVDGEGQAWTGYGLPAPSVLLKAFVQRSGCFRLVDRGAGMEALQRERELASGGALQRGSNMGAGQVKAADYVLVADIAAKDQNSGGSAIGGILGGVVGGRAGAVLGGLRTQSVEATTVLSLMNVRTSEVEQTFEGFAKKTDLSFGGGAGWWGGGIGGGAYESTDVGKVVGLAFLDSYRQMVGSLGGLEGTSAANAAPRQAFEVRSGTVDMKRSPANASSTVRSLDAGQMVYPTGPKEGMWWEVEDENGNVGWVMNDKLQPKK